MTQFWLKAKAKVQQLVIGTVTNTRNNETFGSLFRFALSRFLFLFFVFVFGDTQPAVSCAVALVRLGLVCVLSRLSNFSDSTRALLCVSKAVCQWSSLLTKRTINLRSSIHSWQHLSPKKKKKTTWKRIAVPPSSTHLLCHALVAHWAVKRITGAPSMPFVVSDSGLLWLFWQLFRHKLNKHFNTFGLFGLYGTGGQQLRALHQTGAANKSQTNVCCSK